MKIVVFNKPYDVLSQFREDEAHLTVSSFIKDPELRIAGRLDLDSEGLMFLTDHGGLNQFITHPSNKKYKTYLAQVDGDVTEEALEQLRNGVELADGMTLPAKAMKVDEPEWLWDRDPPVRYRASIPTSWIELQICEGRNRQVRRMTAAVGFPTLRLIRTQIGSINLIRLGLQPGEQTEIEPLLFPDFKDLPEDKPYRSRSYVKKPAGLAASLCIKRKKKATRKTRIRKNQAPNVSGKWMKVKSHVARPMVQLDQILKHRVDVAVIAVNFH